MVEQIRSNWDYNQQSSGTVMVRFTIQRDGTIASVQVERSSGYPTLDFPATRAVLLTRKLPPLPQPYTEPTLGVHLSFEYSR
jgi:TonB family protein